MTAASEQSWVSGLAGERATIGRLSTTERVADILRSYVTEGRLLPGTRLSEEELGSALGVSRNTLREAFRLLTHEGLLVHEFNRGVSVRTLDEADLHDLYAFRRVVECAAVRAAGTAGLDRVEHAVEEGESGAAAGDWYAVGTANMHFHQALVDLCGSERLSLAASYVLAQQRLIFHVMAAPREFHESYLVENRRLLELLAAGRLEEAATALDEYFDVAERQLSDALSHRR